MNPYHVKVAAEAYAAGMLAHSDCDVSVQYGADQPYYDLIAAKQDRLIKISVKGSQDGSWGLTQTHLQNADYGAAIDAWLARHGEQLVFCLVQFRGVALGECPRAYLATAGEIAAHLRAVRGGLGDTILHETHTYVRGRAAGVTDSIPVAWRFTVERIDELMQIGGHANA